MVLFALRCVLRRIKMTDILKAKWSNESLYLYQFVF